MSPLRMPVAAPSGFGQSLGLPLYRVTSCDGGLLTTNVAFGGANNQTLFTTNSLSQNILTAELPHPGEKMFGLMS